MEKIQKRATKSLSGLQDASYTKLLCLQGLNSLQINYCTVLSITTLYCVRVSCVVDIINSCVCGDI